MIRSCQGIWSIFRSRVYFTSFDEEFFSVSLAALSFISLTKSLLHHQTFFTYSRCEDSWHKLLADPQQLSWISSLELVEGELFLDIPQILRALAIFGFWPMIRNISLTASESSPSLFSDKPKNVVSTAVPLLRSPYFDCGPLTSDCGPLTS